MPTQQQFLSTARAFNKVFMLEPNAQMFDFLHPSKFKGLVTINGKQLREMSFAEFKIVTTAMHINNIEKVVLPKSQQGFTEATPLQFEENDLTVTVSINCIQQRKGAGLADSGQQKEEPGLYHVRGSYRLSFQIDSDGALKIVELKAEYIKRKLDLNNSEDVAHGRRAGVIPDDTRPKILRFTPGTATSDGSSAQKSPTFQRLKAEAKHIDPEMTPATNTRKRLG